MMVKKMTPVLLVDQADACVDFWVKRFGFEKTVEVPGEHGIGFAILQSGGVELMYQTFASVQADDPHLADAAKRGPAFLYVEVDSLDEVIGATTDANITMPERQAPYGMREIGVKDPAGHVILFAERTGTPAAAPA